MNQNYLDQKIAEIPGKVQKLVDENRIEQKQFYTTVENAVQETVDLVARDIQNQYLSSLFSNQLPVMLLQEYYYQDNGVKQWLNDKEYKVYNPESLLFVKKNLTPMIDSLNDLAEKLPSYKKELATITQHLEKIRLEALIINFQSAMSPVAIPLYEAKEALRALMRTAKELTKADYRVLDRSFSSLEELKAKGSDAVVALPDHVNPISHQSFEVAFENNGRPLRKSVAAVVATHPDHQKNILFASLHAPGFDFEKPNPADVETATLFIQHVIEQCETIAKVHNCYYTVIGADMNCSVDQEVAAPVFNALKDRRYTICGSDTVTNIDYRRKAAGETTHVEKKIDYLFIKRHTWKMTRWMGMSISADPKITSYPLISCDYRDKETSVKIYPSDHAPLTIQFDSV